MKFGLARNSIFAILLRSPWWVSAIVAMLLLALMVAVLPRQYAGFGVFGVLPFAGIALRNGWRQLRAPSAARQDQLVDTLRAMTWNEFAAVLEQGLRQDGCQVQKLGAGPADFELDRAGKLALVCAKRWKAAHIGVAPLRDLLAAQHARPAQESLYVALGEFSEAARQFAVANAIRVMGAPELLRLLPPSLLKK